MGRFAYDEADDLRRRIHLAEMRITHLEAVIAKLVVDQVDDGR